MRPHRRWAERVRDRAAVFGVARVDVSFVDVLSALEDVGHDDDKRSLDQGIG